MLKSKNSAINSIFKSKNILPFLIVLLLESLAYGYYKGVQDNYLVQVVGVSAFERGLLEMFRELPGLLLIFILAFMSRWTETRIMKIGMGIMLIGTLGLYFCNGTIVPAFLLLTLYSVGDHIVLPVKSTIALEHAKDGQGGKALGIMNGVVNAGNVIGLLIVSALFYYFRKKGVSASLSSFKTVFLVASLFMALALVISTSMKEGKKNNERRQRLYFRKKYWRYYILEISYGARKQVFLTFGPFVLLRVYGADTSTLSMLLALSALCSVFFSPLIGRIIDRVGYKTVMVADTLILIVVCLLYGFSHQIMPMDIAYIVVSINYIFDTILSLASMATNVYVQELSDSQEELTATVTTGISVNHLISILIAFFGGVIWDFLGVGLLFALSAFLGLLNSIFATTIPVESNAN